MESKYAEKPQDIELTESEVTKTRPPYGDDNEYIVNKDTETILKDSSRKSSRKWRLEGVNIVVVSVIILSAAITIALILSIIFGEPQVAPHGAVVVDDDFCGEVGLNIMKIHKGNAIDAMVSTIVCLTVTRPDVASLGGCGAMMVRDRNKQTSHLFDFSCPARNNVADKDKPNRSNYASLVGIPALVRGLATMHKQFGSLKWSDLFNGAIDLATNGFKMGFAGFTIESFPPPLVGGVYLLLLLGNLDLKESMNALNHEALLKADPYVTAIYLHRLVELSRLAEASVTTLGDIDDPKIRDTATNAQNSLFSKSSREASVTSIKDNNIVPEHSLLDVLKTTSEGSSIGSTGFVTTDSTSFTVVGNIYMGSPFGSGNIVPGTGVHLNSVLRLFSESKLNNFSAGRRPLVPIGPTYVTTTHRKCGIRVGVASSDGLWGLTDAAQVISNAALFLRNSKCQASIRTFGSPTTEFGIASSTVKEQTSTPLLGRAVFSPATENSCINPDISVSLSRLHPAYNPRNPGTITVETPDNNNPKLLKHLEGFGHPIQTLSTRQWPGRVFLAGWNGYDMIASGDPRSADSKTLHKY
uniref:Uncharacterized protein n=1 Tax=Trichobilharzia regenti TaxID=157069 RepID=A0AA85INW5_TRIRE|nr:unnamed protein product [Trichobilharzia regenti]